MNWQVLRFPKICISFTNALFATTFYQFYQHLCERLRPHSFSLSSLLWGKKEGEPAFCGLFCWIEVHELILQEIVIIVRESSCTTVCMLLQEAFILLDSCWPSHNALLFCRITWKIMLPVIR